MAKTEQTGLYDATNEHDACGVGMVVNIHGNKSHELVDSALKVLENMRHRGAEGADNKTCLLYTSIHNFSRLRCSIVLFPTLPLPVKGSSLRLFFLFCIIQGYVAPLARAYADGIFNGDDENTSVAYLAGVRRLCLLYTSYPYHQRTAFACCNNLIGIILVEHRYSVCANHLMQSQLNVFVL